MIKTNENWVMLFRCNDEIKLQKIKTELEEANIPYTVINKKDSSFLIGDYEIFVPLDKISEAKKILKGVDVSLE
ncbi:MAG: putative signal transducing protein [Bacteroidales bacterium]